MLRAVLVVILGVLAAPAGAATPGFVEDFTAGSAGFGGGSVVTHVTSGGVVGSAYISISNSVANNLGAFSTDANLVGDLPADGVTGYSFWLRDTGADDALEIHVGIGTMSNFWLSVPGFAPPNASWQNFSVDLTNPSQWVQIIGAGTFQNALASSDRLLFRHDVPPLTQNPNPIAADFGLDRIQVLPAPATVPAVSAAGRAALGVLLCAVVALGLYRRSRSRAQSRSR